MRPRDIDRFFALLGKRVESPVQIILTGGGAAILEGVSRATRDLDFQIVLRTRSAARRQALQEAILRVERETGIAAQYDAAIETWSSISWPARRPKSASYKMFGCIEVRILDPLWWSVGKLTRYLSYDISDVVTVFKTTRISPDRAARAWGKALGRSPLSNAQPIFRRQVLDFFASHGRRLWGSSFDSNTAVRLFLQSARRKRT